MSNAPAVGREAIEQLFRHPELSMERLPVLNDAFASLVSDCGEGIRELCPHPVIFALEETKLGKSSDIFSKYPEGIACVFHAKGWDTRLVIALERSVVLLLTESVFGGDGTEEPEAAERPFSKLELRLGQKIAELAAGSLNRFLGDISAIELQLERVEAELSPNLLGPGEPQVATAEIDIQLLERRGSMFVMIPQQGIYPRRAKLESREGNKSASVDENWTSRLKSGVENTTVALRAHIRANNSTLREVAALKVGSVIELPLDSQNAVVATCNGSQVCTARLVQSKGQYAIAINAFTNRPSEC